MVKNTLIAFAFFQVLFNLEIYAQTCCSGGVPLSNNIGLPFLNKGDIQLGLYYDYNNLNTLNDGTEILNDNSRLRTTNSVLLNFSYNISSRFLVEGLFTWVNQKREIVRSGNANLDETNGLGDGVLLARYLLLSDNKYSLSLGLGAKLPIGSSEEVNASGILLNADLQPGSNAFDGIFTSTFTLNPDFRPSMNFMARATYRETGTNNTYQRINKYTFGNEFQFFVGVTDSFFLFGELFSPSVTFKYRIAEMDKISSNQIPNTGGNWVFINPSFSFKITPKISFATRVELPIYSNVDGVQLTPTYRINTGLSFQLSTRSKKLFRL